MWKNITDTIGNITTVAVQLIGLSVALEVVFGANVPNVAETVSSPSTPTTKTDDDTDETLSYFSKLAEEDE